MKCFPSHISILTRNKWRIVLIFLVRTAAIWYKCYGIQFTSYKGIYQGNITRLVAYAAWWRLWKNNINLHQKVNNKFIGRFPLLVIARTQDQSRFLWKLISSIFIKHKIVECLVQLINRQPRFPLRSSIVLYLWQAPYKYSCESACLIIGKELGVLVCWSCS